MTAARPLIAILVALVACSTQPPPPPDARPSAWSEGPTLLSRRLEPGVAALGDRLVVLGGFDNSLEEGLHITTDVDILDTGVPAAEQAWTHDLVTFPVAPRAWTHIQLAASGPILYLLGGLEGQEYIAKGDTFALNTADPTLGWAPIATMPTTLERGSAAVIVVPPRIYLLGGASTNVALASNLYYDTIMDAWCPGLACTPDQQLPDLPFPRSHPAGMRMDDGTLVLVGGLATLDSSQPAADVWWLPFDQQNAAGHWIPKTPMPTARGGCAYGVVGGRLVCAGGEAGPSALHQVEAYAPFLDPGPGDVLHPEAWTELERLPSERAGAQGAAIGERLFVPGGAQELKFEPLDTLLELDVLAADTGSAARLGSP